jgi:subtilisin family serine protease
VFDGNGNADNADVADAIIEAVVYGKTRNLRTVINYSGGATQASSTVESAIAYAKKHNTLVVACTHNDSDHNAGRRRSARWPARYSTEYNNVIGVGAIDGNNNLANFSNIGKWVCVVAPGVNIRSCLPNYITTQNPTGVAYQNWDGTSMATPHVTGLAALILSINPGLSAQRVREIIETTADDLGVAGKDDNFGWGRINCERAVSILTGGVIFRWYNGNIRDHFYTNNATGEIAPENGYSYEGAAFRLFPINTQNTVPFHRWWNGNKGDHFYTSDPNGELAPQSGYSYEGTIGNIATAQIAGTIPLYRWYKGGAKADHFYTTDPNGELAPQGGYSYEGIAGYVLPV